MTAGLYMPRALNSLCCHVHRYSGRLSGGAGFEPDDLWGMALQCGENSSGLVVVEEDGVFGGQPLPSSEKGALSINLWLKFNAEGRRPVDDHVFHYLFSQDNSATAGYDSGPWRSNQVQIYLPAQQHSAHGVARAILRDAYDSSGRNLAFLDSDGLISFNGPRSKLPHTNLADERWHMLTVTTLPEGGKGYRMFVDGSVAGELAPGAIAFQPVELTGGDTISLSGPIYLCGHKVGTRDRHFPGMLAGIGIWQEVGRLVSHFKLTTISCVYQLMLSMLYV